MKCYFAAPWFSPEQAAIHARVHTVLRTSRHAMFSPKHELEVKPDDPPRVRRTAFVNNLVQIQQCDFVVAVTDYKDIGTIWECGYAFRSGKPIIYYAETLGDRPFNLMLAESGVAIIRSIEELEQFLHKIESPSDLKIVRPYEGAVE